MEFTRTLKSKQVTKHQDDLIRQAEDKIYLSDFNDNLFIAYDGTPLVPIEEDWTPKTIIEELSKLRQNYVNSKMKDYEPTFLESLFKSSC
jgi:hypothetical protein